MLKHIGYVLLAIVYAFNSYSCDVCGSSTIGGGTVYNLTNQKMIGISYSYGSNSYTDRSFEEWSYKIHKKTVTVNSLWNISKAFQLEVNIPFEQNKRQYLYYTEQFESLGDVQMGVNHYCKLGNDSTSTWMLKTSFLNELPIVKLNSEFYNRINMQNTSRSIDAIGSVGILKTWKKFSIYGSTKVKYSIVELIDYRFGNTYLAEIVSMYTVETPNKR